MTPATTAWRRAVDSYAKITGRSSAGDRRWVWRKRRHVRQFLKPDGWWECSITGLDGYTYRIGEPNVDHLGNQTYLLTSEDGRGFYLLEDALEDLAKLQIMPGALTKIMS